MRSAVLMRKKLQTHAIKKMKFCWPMKQPITPIFILPIEKEDDKVL
jgi:hypothetical protein